MSIYTIYIAHNMISDLFMGNSADMRILYVTLFQPFVRGQPDTSFTTLVLYDSDVSQERGEGGKKEMIG